MVLQQLLRDARVNSGNGNYYISVIFILLKIGTKNLFLSVESFYENNQKTVVHISTP